MPALTMTIEVKNLDTAIHRVEKIAEGLVMEMGPALLEIGELGSKYFGGVAFESKGSAFGEPWAELAPSTRAEKAKNWPGRPDMYRTGTMQNSFTYEVEAGSAVRLYNTAPWFVYHQSAADRTKLPRRIMIGLTGSFETIARTAVKKQVAVIIEGSKI